MAIDFTLPPELEDLRTRVRRFIDEVVRPVEKEIDEDDRASLRAGVIKMRKAAIERGLWLPHMPKEWGGMGLQHMELALVSAEAARTRLGPFAINCQAPDEGNMHTLLHWGTDEQKQRYLKPLCEGRVRSCFAMTEPEVAGSDPTLIQTRAVLDGDEWVINGHKWYISGARGAKFAILVARTEENPPDPAGRQHGLHRRHPVARAGTTCATSRRWTVAPGTPRSSSITCAFRAQQCSVDAGKDIYSASIGSARRVSRIACAGSVRPRWRSR